MIKEKIEDEEICEKIFQRLYEIYPSTKKTVEEEKEKIRLLNEYSVRKICYLYNNRYYVPLISIKGRGLIFSKIMEPLKYIPVFTKNPNNEKFRYHFIGIKVFSELELYFKDLSF